MSGGNEPLQALREELLRLELDGFIVPSTDAHLSEFPGEHARRLAWLTGFRGSTATAAVLHTAAAIFVDGRYVLQVRNEVDLRLWSPQSGATGSLCSWLTTSVAPRSRIGYDPWLHSKAWVHGTRAALLSSGSDLVAVDSNPIDRIWHERPAPSMAKAACHPIELAGKDSVDKRRQLGAWLTQVRADAVVLCALDSIAWTLNLRGTDIPHTPVAEAYGLLNSDGSFDLFIAASKIDEKVRDHLGGGVRVHPVEAFCSHLGAFAGKTVAADPERTVNTATEALERCGAKLLEVRDPVLLPKAIKNTVEIAGHRAAQKRDGIAVTRFLHWLSDAAVTGQVSEISAAARLHEFRQDTGELCDLSFTTISAFGPHGALAHYQPTPKENLRLSPGSLYLVDSGGQYRDGTTDIARTVAIGSPTPEMRDRFSRVLKGHIALASALFPSGTVGPQLDALARQYLWAIGQDYNHGTGHGVGSYLSVHEGPQRITRGWTPILGGEVPLAAGMILSNEPGYYKPDKYGIRIENLVLVVPAESCNNETQTLGFDTLSLAPLDRTLIDVSMLTRAERSWIDKYHESVAQTLLPQLDTTVAAWLSEVTRPLDRKNITALGHF